MEILNHTVTIGSLIVAYLVLVTIGAIIAWLAVKAAYNATFGRLITAIGNRFYHIREAFKGLRFRRRK